MCVLFFPYHQKKNQVFEVTTTSVKIYFYDPTPLPFKRNKFKFREKKNIQIELNNNNNDKNEDDTIICKLFDKSYTPQNAGLIIVREKNANMWTSIPHFA